MPIIQVDTECSCGLIQTKKMAAELVAVIQRNISCPKEEITLIIRQQSTEQKGMENVFEIKNGKETSFDKMPTLVF